MRRLEWSYEDDEPDGRRHVAIFLAETDGRSSATQLDRDASRLLLSALKALAQEPGINWNAARQACLRAFQETCGSRDWLADHPRPKRRLPAPPPVRVVRKGLFVTREWTGTIGEVERRNDERRWRKRRRWWQWPGEEEAIPPMTITDSTP